MILSKIISLVPIEDDFSDKIVPAGTLGIIEEYYKDSEQCAITLYLPNKDLIGSIEYIFCVAYLDEFKIID
jgi:hypothetical protein